MRARAALLVLGVVALVGCGGSEEVGVEETPSESPSQVVTEASSPSEQETTAGGEGVYAGSADDATVEVDLSGTATGLAEDAATLLEAVGGPPMTFVVARVDNGGDDPVTLEAVEVTDDTGTVLSLAPAVTVARELRSAVDLYDTETYEQATRLLEAVELQTATAAPGATTEHLLVADGTLSTPAEVVAVGSFGRATLRRL